MNSKPVTIDVNVTARTQSPLFGFLSTVVISLTREFEEYIVDNDDSVSSIGFYPDSSPNPRILLELENLKPNYVYQILQDRLNDHDLSQQISDKIVLEAQRQISQSFKEPLFIEVFVRITKKVVNVVPRDCAPAILDSEICAICLEIMWRSRQKDEPICYLPNCLHRFHEECVNEWFERGNKINNSCPLCRKPMLEECNDNEGGV